MPCSLRSLFVLSAAGLTSACGPNPYLMAECQKGPSLSLAEYLEQDGVQLVPRQGGGSLTAQKCPTLSDDVTVTITGQQGDFHRAGGKLYVPTYVSFHHSSPERCECETTDFFAPFNGSPDLEISLTQGEASVFARYENVVSTMRRVPAPTPDDAPPGAVAFWVEAAQRLSALELEQARLKVQQRNASSWPLASCPVEIRPDGLVVATPCSQTGEPDDRWSPELHLSIFSISQTRQPTHCEGLRCEPLTFEILPFEDVFPL